MSTGSHRTCEICGIKERHARKPLKFARFPIDENRCKEWVKVVGKEDLLYLPIEKLNVLKHVCEYHFKKSDFKQKSGRLKMNAVPTLNLSLPPLSEKHLIGFPMYIFQQQRNEVKFSDAHGSIAAPSSIDVKRVKRNIAEVNEVKFSDAHASNAASSSIDVKRVKRNIAEVNEVKFSDAHASNAASSSIDVKRVERNIAEVNEVKFSDAHASNAASSSIDVKRVERNIAEVNEVKFSDAHASNAASSSIDVKRVKRNIAEVNEVKFSDAHASNAASSSIDVKRVKRNIAEVNEVKFSDAHASNAASSSIDVKRVERNIAEVNEEVTPRKKKLIQQLIKTKCTLKSLKKRAIMLEKIQSPVLKEIVVNACKNQTRKPRGRRWTTEHKISCLAILKRSRKTYRYLSAAVPLPSIKTLQNILKKVPLETGINKSVLNHLKSISENRDPKDRLCCLLFDEMAIKSRLIYNEATDLVEGFEDLGEFGRSNELANHALVFMLQGLRSKFKQPLAFYFTKSTISSAKLAVIIKDIITQVSDCGFKILNTVCDQGPTNMGALKLLREGSGPSEDGSSEHYFKVNNEKVYIVYDVPHLFKSLRNNFLNAGSLLMDNKIAKWEHLVQVEAQNKEFLYLSKITESHVKPKYKQKMRVKYAAQLLSNTVAAVLKLLSRAEQNEQKANELLYSAKVIEELDKLFDATNGPSGPDDIKKSRRENVSAKSKHLDLWAEYIKKLEKMKFLKKNGSELTNVKCVKGYIITLKSFREIYKTVKDMGFKYLNLRSLNQDALENCFGMIRQHSPTNRNPTASHFIAALKTAVVTRMTAPHSRGANCEKDNKTLLTDFQSFVFGSNDTNIDPETPETPEKTPGERYEIMTEEDDNTAFLCLPESDDEEILEDLTKITDQPAVYVAGYLAGKLVKKTNCPNCKKYLTAQNPEENPNYAYIFLREWWKNKLSLTYPSTDFCKIILNLVNITEKELLPKLHEPNISTLCVTMYTMAIDSGRIFQCALHARDLSKMCYNLLSKLLIRRQCKRINVNLSLKEEDLASLNKRAEQLGKSK